jgi:hypothetical protein
LGVLLRANDLETKHKTRSDRKTLGGIRHWSILPRAKLYGKGGNFRYGIYRRRNRCRQMGASSASERGNKIHFVKGKWQALASKGNPGAAHGFTGAA